MKNGNTQTDDVDQLISLALSEHAIPYIMIDQDKTVYRVQPTEYGDDPRYYNPSTDYRYSDRDGKVGVCFVAGSGETAVAETLQHGKPGPGTPVLRSEIEARSLYTLTIARELKMVDAAALAANSGFKLDAIVAAKGQEAEGYMLSQALTAACLPLREFDGIIYPSRVNPKTGSFLGCNLALFDGRDTQLTPESGVSLVDHEFSTGETIGDVLIRLKVQVE
jgi:hypothetical protein